MVYCEVSIIMKLSLTECALCHSKDQLELSHIIPKFVVRYFKETSAGSMRCMENPNITVQDGEKHYLLCGKCEDLFSTYEKQFADIIFHPYFKDNQRSFNYDTWLHYFITSVSWRHLYLDLLDFVENHIVGLDALECLIKCEQIMRDYLLGKRTDIEKIEHHIFFYEEIDSIPDELKSMRPHASIHRSIGGYTAANEETKTYFTVTNMMGIFLFTLYSKGDEELWENTQVLNGNGIIEAKDQHIKSVCGQEIISMIKSAEETMEKLSEKQQQKINERFQKAIKTNKSFPILEDFKKDYNL